MAALTIAKIECKHCGGYGKGNIFDLNHPANTGIDIWGVGHNKLADPLSVEADCLYCNGRGYDMGIVSTRPTNLLPTRR